MSIPPPDEFGVPVTIAAPQAPAPLDGFTPDEFRSRRVALRAQCPDGIILVRGASESDVVSPGIYRQNSTFFYLTGVTTPDSFLVMLPDNVPSIAGMRDLAPEAREILFLPARNPATETWTGPKLGPGTETEVATGVAKVADAGGLYRSLLGWIRRCPLIYTVAPYGSQAKSTPEYALMQRIADQAPIVRFLDILPALTTLRTVKSAAEVERLRQAIAITAEGQKAARALIAGGAGRHEYEVEAAIFHTFRNWNANLAFPSIVGAGVNGTILHYEDNRDPLRAGDLVVVDIGARLGYYCGDLTRTYPVGGEFTPRQREIYSLVLDAHERTIAGYRSGEDTLSALNDRCKAFLKDSPLRARDAAGAEQTMDTFMPHGLGHHLGLDVHDIGFPEVPLEPGNVITVEPGIYIPSEGIGVRIEDDYLVTDSGLERLGPPLEKDISALEAVMRAR